MGDRENRMGCQLNPSSKRQSLCLPSSRIIDPLLHQIHLSGDESTWFIGAIAVAVAGVLAHTCSDRLGHGHAKTDQAGGLETDHPAHGLLRNSSLDLHDCSIPGSRPNHVLCSREV